MLLMVPQEKCNFFSNKGIKEKIPGMDESDPSADSKRKGKR